MRYVHFTTPVRTHTRCGRAGRMGQKQGLGRKSGHLLMELKNQTTARGSHTVMNPLDLHFCLSFSSVTTTSCHLLGHMALEASHGTTCLVGGEPPEEDSCVYLGGGGSGSEPHAPRHWSAGAGHQASTVLCSNGSLTTSQFPWGLSICLFFTLT